MPGVKQVTDTQSDWQQGTLTDVVATGAGDLELAKIWATDDFERVNIGDNWVEESPSVPRWSIDAGRLKSEAVTVDGYNSIWYTAMDVSGENIVIEYDVYFTGTASRLWGGFDYRGVGVDVNPIRTGIRNGPEHGETFIRPGISVGVWHHVKAIITVRGHPNDELKLYVDGNLIFTDTFRAPYTSPYVGLRSTHYTDDGGYALYDNFLIDKGYLTSGSRISPALDLSTVGTAAGSSISWAATTPTGTSVTVETRLSLDGGSTWGAWQACTNGGAIPGITPGMDLSNARLQTRQNLATTDTTVTPQLHSLTVAVPVAGSASAPVLVQIGVSRSVALPVPVSVGLAKAVTVPVRYEVGMERLRSVPFRANVLTLSRRFSPTRLIAAQLWIARPDGHAWEDVTEYLRMASWRLGDVANLGTGKEGVDERVRTAVFELQQDRPAENSLSPRDRASAWNLYQGEYAPLIWPRRHVVYRVAIGDPVSEEPNQHVTTRWAEWVATTDGESRTYRITPAPLFPERVRVYLNGVLLERGVDYTVDYDTGEVTFAEVPPAGLHITADYTYWRTAFEGYIDSWQVRGSSIEVVCRDLAARIQDAYIEEARAYGSSEGEPLEDVLQRMLDENLGEGLVTLHYTKPSGFMVTPYLVEYQTIWDALQNAVIKTVGWYLGYMYDRWQNRFTLQLIEPPRHKGVTDADWELDWRDDIYVDEVGGSITDVRNVCWVTYRDRESGKRQVVKYEDQASIQEYGRRAMQIEEADASYIDTYEEAYALARAAVEDLKDQHATVRLEIPFQPLMDVMDAMVVIDERISSTPDFFAVESIEQTMDFARGRYRTTIVGSGKVTGAHSRWLEMQTRPGAQQPVRMISADAVEVTQSRPPKPRDVRAYGVTGGIVVTVPEPPLMKNWRFTRVRVYDDDGELVVEDAARATRFQFLGLAAGARYHAEAQYEDNEGTTGDWSDRASAVASGEFTALALVVQESVGVGTDLTVGRDATIAGKASVGMLESQGAVSGTVVRATQYIQLPVLSADPPSPPNGAMWMRE